MKPTHQNIQFDHKLLDKDALKVIEILHKAEFEVYLVGGCVRDLLLGLAPKDFDIATSAKPEQAHKLFRRSRLIGRRFRLLHVLFSARKFIEVATFRSGQAQVAQTGVIVRDNCYGTMATDVVRRDFKVNALYYDVYQHKIIDYVGGLQDIEARQICMIGDSKLRFEQDPVRMIRAIRFQVKLNATLSAEVERAIYAQSALLSHISPARLYEECLKLFHQENAFEVYEELEKYGLLPHLFRQTSKTDFVKDALLNTAMRIKNHQSVTPVFIFAVFLWQALSVQFAHNLACKKPAYLAMTTASNTVISAQIKQVALPKWLTFRIKEIWLMQLKLEQCHSKKARHLLTHPGFRIAYDFLVLRAQSINPELTQAADFWTKIQQSQPQNGQ